jgi:uncharacterized membrane protein
MHSGIIGPAPILFGTAVAFCGVAGIGMLA